MKHALITGAVAPACPPPSPRRLRSPWVPTPAGPYRLPRSIQDRLTVALEGFRNRDAAFALAHFLARFWSAPRRLLCAFPIDRRALAEHEALGLTEARVRGALAVLVEVGFLARYEPESGKRYQRTEGGLQRRAILHRFGEDYGVEFGKANAAAQQARGAPAPARRPVARPEPRTSVRGGPTGRVALSGSGTLKPLTQLAQKHSTSERGLIMGEQNRAAPESPLEAAIERLRRGVGL